MKDITIHTQATIKEAMEALDKTAEKVLLVVDDETFAKAPFCPITTSGSNFNPRNIQYIPVVKIFAFLVLEQN